MHAPLILNSGFKAAPTLLPELRRANPRLLSDVYTINAVAQDDFSDVPMPDAPAGSQKVDATRSEGSPA